MSVSTRVYLFPADSQDLDQGLFFPSVDEYVVASSLWIAASTLSGLYSNSFVP